MTWIVAEQDLPQQMQDDARSAVFSIGNGQIGTRGTRSEDGPGAFRAVIHSGVFTKAGWGLRYFQPCPDWLPAFIEVDGQRIAPTHSHRSLDLKTGCLLRTASFFFGDTRVEWTEERFLSFALPHAFGQRVELAVRGHTPFTLGFGLEGTVFGSVAKYYKPDELPNCTPHGLRLTQIEMAEVREGLAEVVLLAPSTQTRTHALCAIDLPEGRIGEASGALLRCAIHPTGPQNLTFEKVGVLAGDIPGCPPADERICAAWDALPEGGYEAVRAAHIHAVTAFWNTADVEVEEDPQATLAIRFGIWSTRIAAPLDGGASSTGAKNLTGDWYRGAVFWDMDQFHIPLLAALCPERARNHIAYRFQRRHAANTLATQDGYQGFRFPWQSFQSGLEEPPVVGGGFLYQLQHVNCAVVVGILQTWQLTGDDAMMLEQGLELVLGICQFWASRLEPGDDGRLHLRRITGPDEDHQAVDDNAYTNRMVQFVLEQGATLFTRFQASHPEHMTGLSDRLGLADTAPARWTVLADRIHLPLIPGTQVLEAFQGFSALPEPDETCRGRQGMRADKPSKQADTLLLFQALPNAFTLEDLQSHWREYAPLCTHGSSLSSSTHSILATRLGLAEDATRLFRACCRVDLEDGHANTAHGIHGAGEAGVWMAAVQGFGGLVVSETGVDLRANLPPDWSALRYRFQLHGQPLRVCVRPAELELQNLGTQTVRLSVRGTPLSLPPRETTRIPGNNRHWRERQLEAVLFDLDGVLVSTDHCHYLAWKELADEVGLPFDEEKNHALRGVSREESLRRIYGEHPLPDPEIFARQMQKKNERYRELIGRMSPADVLPGALDLLKSLRASGIRTAIASASRNTPLVLDRTGLSPWIDAVADGNIVTAGKPDPQVFFLAAQRVRCLPWNCIGVEDAAAGVEAIHRAGMPALGVGTQVDAADLVVTDSSQITLDLLRRVFADNRNDLDPYLERNAQRLLEDLQTSYSTTLVSGKK